MIIHGILRIRRAGNRADYRSRLETTFAISPVIATLALSCQYCANNDLDHRDKKVLDNLKKLFISRDNNLIFQGLEMFRSLENAAVSKYFLDGVKYSSKSDGRLIPNSIFSGTGPAQSYLNYALLGVIAYAPNDCEIANNFKSSIKFLNIETKSKQLTLEIT